jgi:pyridoxamine 5'-phosphate oxidase
MNDLSSHIARLREDFSRGTLSETDVAADPFSQFTSWLQQAVEAKVTEVQAMHLATVAENGRPSSRVVYLREFGDNRFSFYTNYLSRKASELEKNPYACLTFFWPELERQIRIEGRIERAGAAQSDAYYNTQSPEPSAHLKG